MTEAVGDQHALPGNYGLGSLPPQLSERRCGIRDAAIDINAGNVGSDALHLSAVNRQHRVLGRRGTAGRKGQYRENQQRFFHTHCFFI